MSIESLTQSPWVSTFARSLAHSLWQGALLAAVLAIVLRFTPSYRSGLRYSLAFLGFAGFLLLPALNIGVMSASNLDMGIVMEQITGAEGESGAQLNRLMSLSANLAIPWEGLATVLYTLGVVLLAGRLMVQLLYLRQLRRITTPVDEILHVRLRMLAAQTNMARVPQLAFSNRIDTAMVMGWRAPLILLPANIKSHLTPKQLDGVLLHELAHVKTQDYAVNFLQLLAETSFFYHPAVWWVSGVVRQEREYRCDDLAAQACGDRRDYAEALLALEKARSRPTVAVALAGTSGDFAARIQRLFGRPVPHTSAIRLALRLAFALTLGVSAGFAQQRSPVLSPPATAVSSPQNPAQPGGDLTPSTRGGDKGQEQPKVDQMTKQPFEEPTPTECAALGGQWFHIKMPQVAEKVETRVIDPGIAVPLDMPDVTFHIETPDAEFRGRCMIGQPGK